MSMTYYSHYIHVYMRSNLIMYNNCNIDENGKIIDSRICVRTYQSTLLFHYECGSLFRRVSRLALFTA